MIGGSSAALEVEPSLGCQKISVTISLWLLNFPDCNMWCAVELETKKTPCNTKDELKAIIMAASINLRRPMEKLAGDCHVIWRRRFKAMAISLNEFTLSYFKIFSCNFDKYVR